MMSPECPDLTELKSVLLEFNQQLVPYFIEHVSINGIKAFVKFEDVNSPEMAATLKGCSVYLAKTERPKLERGEFYNDEVVGFEVVEAEKGLLGPVKEVLEAGPSRYLIVIYDQKEVMIPIHGLFIKGINKSGKKISVELPEGFLEI